MPELILPIDFPSYEWEVESKGYFCDATVRVGGRTLMVTFFDPARLAQDIARSWRPAGFSRHHGSLW